MVHGSPEKQTGWTANWVIERREEICAQFEDSLRRWQQGQGPRPRAEDFLDEVPLEHRWEFLHCLLLLEEDYRQRAGEGASLVREFRGRFPQFSSDIAMAFQHSEQPAGSARQHHGASPATPRRVREYELQEKIGQGGMGIVWKALHVKLRKHRAVKVLHSHMLESNQARDRFLNEIEALARFEHPNIVRAHDAFEEEGELYLIMEYVDGCNAGELVHHNGTLSVGAACEVIRQAALGLGALHDQHVTHRDIKPANLMLTHDAKTNRLAVKVMDLGLSQLDAQKGLTQSGEVFGTCEFMAPEQWESCCDVAPAADVYSLGCSLYFLITRKPPYTADGNRSAQAVKLMLAHRRDPVPDLGEFSPEARRLQPLLNRMMAKKAQGRFESGGELLQEIEPFADGGALKEVVEGKCDTVSGSISPTRAQAKIEPPKPRKTWRRRATRAGFFSAALMVLAFLLAPRIPIWVDPPLEVVSVPALSERHVTDDLPHLTPAMRLYLKEIVRWGRDSVAGVNLRQMDEHLRDGDLAAVRAGLHTIFRALEEQPDDRWRACGGGVYEVVATSLRRYGSELKKDSPGTEDIAAAQLERLEKELSERDKIGSLGLKTHLRAMLLQQVLNASDQAATAYHKASEEYRREGLPGLSGIAHIEYTRLLVRENMRMGSRRHPNPLSQLYHPEQYCDCQLFRAAALVETGRVLKYKGDYGDAVEKFQDALLVMGHHLDRADNTWLRVENSPTEGLIPLTNPLPGYALRWKAFAELDRFRFGVAAVDFDDLWRKDPKTAATLENYLWGKQGEANALFFDGQHTRARNRFVRLLEKIESIREEGKHPDGHDKLDDTTVEACHRRVPNISERLADVHLYGRSEHFVPDFDEAERHLSKAVELCLEFGFPQHILFRLKYKQRIAVLLKHLAQPETADLPALPPVLTPDEKRTAGRMEIGDEGSFSLEQQLAAGLESLCAEDAGQRDSAVTQLLQLFHGKGATVDRKELGLRLVALEQVINHGQPSQASFVAAQQRLERIESEILQIVNAERAESAPPVESVPFLAPFQSLVEQTMAASAPTL